MVVCRFHNLIIRPVAVQYIGELPQLIHMGIHIIHISGPAQHLVNDGRYLGTGYRVERTECAILIAGDPAVFDGADHLTVEPVGPR